MLRCSLAKDRRPRTRDARVSRRNGWRRSASVAAVWLSQPNFRHFRDLNRWRKPHWSSFNFTFAGIDGVDVCFVHGAGLEANRVITSLKSFFYCSSIRRAKVHLHWPADEHGQAHSPTGASLASLRTDGAKIILRLSSEFTSTMFSRRQRVQQGTTISCFLFISE